MLVILMLLSSSRTKLLAPDLWVVLIYLSLGMSVLPVLGRVIVPQKWPGSQSSVLLWRVGEIRVKLVKFLLVLAPPSPLLLPLPSLFSSGFARWRFFLCLPQAWEKSPLDYARPLS